MQLLVGLRDTWKSIDVQLEDGCTPSVGGVPLSECNIEPALWFKVLVLDSVCVDCSQRVISWSAAPSLPAASGGSHSAAISQALGKNIAQLLTSTDASKKPNSNGMSSPTPSLSSSLHSFSRSLSLRGSPGGQGEGYHSLMAPHEGETSLCQDDLHNLFELAEMLFKVNASCQMHTRGLDVEQRSWLRLLHCYLLPVITLHHDDLSAVERASATHTDIITSLDQRIVENSSKAMNLKQELASLREQLRPGVRVMGEGGRCSKQFLSLFTSDLRAVEEEARNKIQTTMQNLDLSGKLNLPHSSEMEEKFRTEQRTAESVLLETLQLRGALEAALCLLDPLENGAEEGEDNGEELRLQERYMEKHYELEKLRETRSELSKKKVLALSVREALQQTLLALRSGKTTTGMDVGLHGGHSTDVLPEASDYSASNEYTTLRDKVQRLLQLSSGPASHLHQTFCGHLRREYFPAISEEFVLVSQPVSLASFHQRALSLPPTTRRPEKGSPDRRHFSLKSRQKRPRSLPNLQHLAQNVKEHCEKVMEAICQHFNDRDIDFRQRVWLCYERLFFELFGPDFLPLYQAHFAKFCEQLQLNSVSASVVDPEDLNLGITDESWLRLFPPRPFADAQRLYQGFTDQQCLEEERETGDHDAQFWAHFGGVASDLTSVPLVISPLEKLQLLTSAFRKAMAALSELKTQSLLAEVSKEDSVDLALVGVSCDDLLPLLALILLQLDPSFLASLFLHTSLLADYMAPFLEAGWHGYSLAAFRSALQIIAEL